MTYGVGLFAELNAVAPLVVEIVDASVTVFYAICARSPDSPRTHPGDERRELPPQAEQAGRSDDSFRSTSALKPIAAGDDIFAGQLVRIFMLVIFTDIYPGQRQF